jgi:hypothetical protein
MFNKANHHVKYHEQQCSTIINTLLCFITLVAWCFHKSLLGRGVYKYLQFKAVLLSFIPKIEVDEVIETFDSEDAAECRGCVQNNATRDSAAEVTQKRECNILLL